MSDEMPTLYVPNKYSDLWPDERLTLSDTVQDLLEKDIGEHKSLLTVLEADWAAFGKGSKEDVPVKGTVPQVSMAQVNSSAMFENYVQVSDSLKKAFGSLYAADLKVKKKVEDAKLKSDEAQKYVSDLIDALNTQAATPPQDPMSEDEHVMTYITAGMNASVKIMTDANTAMEKTAKDIDKEAEDKSLKERVANLEKAQKDPRLTPDNIGQPPGTPPPGTNPPVVDNSTLPPAWEDLTNPETTPDDVLSTDELDNSGLGGPSSNGMGNLGNTPDVTAPPVTPPVQPASAMSPMGSGMDMMSSMLPMMMQQAMMRNMADQDLNNRRAELDPRRFDEEVAPVVPPAPAPAVAQPAVAQPAVTAPASHSGPPSTGTGGQPVVTPGRTPGADGSVVYTFPDGRTQKVSVMVAQALDGAFGNASGTDAQKAYEKTPAKWSDKKQIGDRVDPYQLMTGDVATWDKRSAILVVFGSDEGGTLEAVVNGELKPFVPEMTDSAGEFGQFAGFAHPKGIELTAPKDESVPSTMPGAADQSVTTAMPAISIPAG
ncbi:hypothetical protein AB0C34_19870 [Nocardia sp. NPDC049220]|uniref:hypothetical protein n=1 Tax=Nocardia sp. NPDC049220 TaxID=3155273 RepID=UPI00340F0133